MVLQIFRWEPVPPQQCQALHAELAARAGKQLGGRGLKRAHDEPVEMTEFSRTSLSFLREAKEELKVAHAEGDAKERRIGRGHLKCP